MYKKIFFYKTVWPFFHNFVPLFLFVWRCQLLFPLLLLLPAACSSHCCCLYCSVWCGLKESVAEEARKRDLGAWLVKWKRDFGAKAEQVRTNVCGGTICNIFTSWATRAPPTMPPSFDVSRQIRLGLCNLLLLHVGGGGGGGGGS